MFTVTFGDLRKPAFAAGLNRIVRLRALPHVTSYNLAKIYAILRDEEKTVGRLYDELLAEYLERDADGKPLPALDHDGTPLPGTLKLRPGVAEELDAKLAEFHRTPIEIHRRQIQLEHVVVELTPEEILALEPLWEPVEETAQRGAPLKSV